MRKIRLALIGAGARGKDIYGEYALNNPHEVQFIAVADPDMEKRELFAKKHNLSPDRCYNDWRELIECPETFDAIIIATQDKLHYEPTIASLEKGYNVLLEKPMSISPNECLAMTKKAQQVGKTLTICHVLRYTPFYTKLKELIDSSVIGNIMSVQHIEKVGYWHHAHSFVRGNWRNSKESSPMILQKCCHDMDILRWLLNKKCVRLSSFGNLSFFTPENAPLGHTAKCTDGCTSENTCPFSALKIYVGKTGWPANVVSQNTNSEAILEALRSGPYGRCVYACDNNVVDHQVVNMEFEGGTTVALTMSAFTSDISRTTHFMGTNGEIYCDMLNNSIKILNFTTGEIQTIIIPAQDGHSGGDWGLMRSFIRQLTTDGNVQGLTSAFESMDSHFMAFAAEKSRLDNKVIIMNDFINGYIS